MIQQHKKIILISLIFLLGTGALFAQNRHKRYGKQYRKHEISLSLGGGISALQYKVTEGRQKNGFGGEIGFGYNFFFLPNLGVGTGLEFALYNASFSLDNSSIRFLTTDMENVQFEFRSTMSDYKEKQYAVMLQIPIMLQFQTGRKHQFYATAGGRIGFPISAKYNNSKAVVQNSGYYEEEDYEYTTQLFMGFGQFSGKSEKLNLKIAVLLSAETGIKWSMNDGYSFYTGVYVDYGLNNLLKSQASPPEFLSFNTTQANGFAINSIINSQYSHNGEMKSFTEKIVPMSVGVRVRLTF
jgi:hypothetical protein